MKLFCDILCCKGTRLHDILNAGRLMDVLPGWSSIRLSGGWSTFWCITRKIAKAVKKQPDLPSARAAVQALHDALSDQDVHPSWLSLLRVITILHKKEDGISYYQSSICVFFIMIISKAEKRDVRMYK